MCRMIAAPMGVSGSLLIEPFFRMARGRNALNEVNTELGKIRHGDGWGAVYEDEGRMNPLRGLRPCWKDPVIKGLLDKPVFLLHARRKSTGSVVLEDTHPFEREIDGARWFFCHNGTVRDPLPDPLVPTEGSTDSEKLLGLLQPYIHEDDVLAGLQTVFGGIRGFTSLNSFLLGPDDLWAVCLHSEKPDYYTLMLTETDAGPIVSSEPLHAFAGKQSALHNGTIVRIGRGAGAIETQTLDRSGRSRR